MNDLALLEDAWLVFHTFVCNFFSHEQCLPAKFTDKYGILQKLTESLQSSKQATSLKLGEYCLPFGILTSSLTAYCNICINTTPLAFRVPKPLTSKQNEI